MIIAIEGIDASGKATQSKILAERLRAKRFSFPDYSTPMGKVIQEYLQGQWKAKDSNPDVYTVSSSRELAAVRDAAVLQACMTVNRLEHRAEILVSQLCGQHIVCDRYVASALVYGVAEGLDEKWIDRIQCLPRADLNLLLDIDPALSRERRPERRDVYEKRSEFYFDELAARYVELWQTKSKEEPGHWHIIDGGLSVDGVAKEIWDVVQAARPTEKIRMVSEPVSESSNLQGLAAREAQR